MCALVDKGNINEAVKLAENDFDLQIQLIKKLTNFTNCSKAA
jgi:hypothetical protein